MSLGRIPYAPLWLFYHGTKTLDRLTQLEGKRIAVGIAAIRVVVTKILGAHGINPDNTTLLPFSGPALVKAMKDGEVDAVFLPSQLDSRIVQSLLRDLTVKLMSLTQSGRGPYANLPSSCSASPTAGCD